MAKTHERITITAPFYLVFLTNSYLVGVDVINELCIIQPAHALSVLIVCLSNDGPGEAAQMRTIARAFDAHVRKV